MIVRKEICHEFCLIVPERFGWLGSIWMPYQTMTERKVYRFKLFLKAKFGDGASLSDDIAVGVFDMGARCQLAATHISAIMHR